MPGFVFSVFFVAAVQQAPAGGGRKDAERAAADLDIATRLKPDHPYLALRRGDLAFLRQDFAAAAEHYSIFTTELPRNPAGYWGLARAQLGQQTPQAALYALEQALALTFQAQEVQDALEELEEMASGNAASPGLEEAIGRLRTWLAEHRGRSGNSEAR